MPHLDDRAVRAGALETIVITDPRAQSCDLGFRAGRAELAPIREVADVVVKLGPGSEDAVGQLEQLLKVPIPRREAKPFVKHRDSVGHVVKGDAQLRLALSDFVQQPGIVHRNHCLRGKALQQRDLLVVERPHFLPVDLQEPQ